MLGPMYLCERGVRRATGDFRATQRQSRQTAAGECQTGEQWGLTGQIMICSLDGTLHGLHQSWENVRGIELSEGNRSQNVIYNTIPYITYAGKWTRKTHVKNTKILTVASFRWWDYDFFLFNFPNCILNTLFMLAKAAEATLFFKPSCKDLNASA